MSRSIEKLTKAELIRLLKETTDARLAAESLLSQSTRRIEQLKAELAHVQVRRQPRSESMSLGQMAAQYCEQHNVRSVTKAELLHWSGGR